MQPMWPQVEIAEGERARLRIGMLGEGTGRAGRKSRVGREMINPSSRGRSRVKGRKTKHTQPHYSMPGQI